MRVSHLISLLFVAAVYAKENATDTSSSSDDLLKAVLPTDTDATDDAATSSIAETVPVEAGDVNLVSATGSANETETAVTTTVAATAIVATTSAGDVTTSAPDSSVSSAPINSTTSSGNVTTIVGGANQRHVQGLAFAGGVAVAALALI